MLPSFCQESITVLRAQTVTDRGSEIKDWSNAESFIVSGCSVQISSSDFSYLGRENNHDTFTLYAPMNADIQAEDRVIYNGETYLISSVPYVWKSPTGSTSHLECSIERWVG